MPGNMYTKEVTSALVLRGGQLAGMTRAKGFVHKCEKALRYKNSNMTRISLGSSKHQGPMKKWPERDLKRETGTS